MRNEERILVLVYQPSVDGISQRCWLFYGLFFFLPRLLLFGIKAKNKIKLCAHKFSWTQRSFVSIFVLFLRNSFVNSFSLSSLLLLLLGEIIRMAAIHLDLSSAIDRWNCCIFLRRAHSFPLWALPNDRTNERRRKNVLITAEKLKIRHGGQPRVVRRIGVPTKIVCNGNWTQQKKYSTLISNVGSISIRSLDRKWNKINEMNWVGSLRTVIERENLWSRLPFYERWNRTMSRRISPRRSINVFAVMWAVPYFNGGASE